MPASTLPLTAIGLYRGGVSVEIADVDDEGWPVAPDAHTVRVLLCDAAHAHGWKPPHGTVAAWSFYPTKTLGALGDGGAVTTDDEGLSDLMRDLCGRDDQLRDRRQVTHG